MKKSLIFGFVFALLGGIWATLHSAFLLAHSLPWRDGYIIPKSLAGIFSFTDLGKTIFSIPYG